MDANLGFMGQQGATGRGRRGGARGWCLGLGVVLALLPATATPQAGAARSVTGRAIAVRIHGARSSNGELVVALYGDEADAFLKKSGRLARERVPARDQAVTVRFEAPRPGLYAVAVYHDENGNRKFDRTWLGLPAEGFGVSNNPRLGLRAPSHAEAAFHVGGGVTVVDINLQY